MNDLIQKIRSANLGKETREPISTLLKSIYDKMIVPVENTEVVQARGSYSNLDERLNANKVKIESANSGLKLIQQFFTA
ncbi:MAG: hypothetical protein ACI4VG_03535 [Lachnospiraceae bacterium]